MKLKETILQTAIELFNARGVANVSPNQIAAALDISTGNLTYHYRTKAILIRTIYERMHEASVDFISTKGYRTLDDFRKGLTKFKQFQEQYSFFFHDMVFITRNYPEVAKLYEASNNLRFERGRQLFDYYIATGRLLPEENHINYDFVIHNVWMTGVFWTVQETIMTGHTPLAKPADMVEMAWSIIWPYLTEKGQEEYLQINAILQLAK